MASTLTRTFLREFADQIAYRTRQEGLLRGDSSGGLLICRPEAIIYRGPPSILIDNAWFAPIFRFKKRLRSTACPRESALPERLSAREHPKVGWRLGDVRSRIQEFAAGPKSTDSR